jgi:hypothetical protein
MVAVSKKNKRRTLREESIEAEEDTFVQQDQAKASSIEVS